ncbi:MAG: lipocalin family protein, partial [Nocardioides sp.]
MIRLRPRALFARLASATALTLAAGIAVSTGMVSSAGAQPAAPATPGAVTPVDALDLTRYDGRWLQLAAIPQQFSAECARDTQAQYTALPDGLIKVENSCVRADGSLSTIEGRARVVGPSPAQLEVTFVQIAGQWI